MSVELADRPRRNPTQVVFSEEKNTASAAQAQSLFALALAGINRRSARNIAAHASILVLDVKFKRGRKQHCAIQRTSTTSRRCASCAPIEGRDSCFL